MKKSLLVVSIILLVSISLTLISHAGGRYVGVAKGTIEGALVTYYDSDTIGITVGYGDCNGNYWEIDTPTTHDMSSLTTAEDFHYIYIDSDSSFPDVTIVDSTAEPSWSDAKMGWYNGTDRCMGVVWSPSGSATILQFTSNMNQKFMYDDLKQILSGGTQNGSWQTVEASYITPVNAKAVHAYAGNSTSGTTSCYMQVTAEDNTKPQLYAMGSYVRVCGWMEFNEGSTRDIQWKGPGGNGDLYFIYVTGYQIDR